MGYGPLTKKVIVQNILAWKKAFELKWLINSDISMHSRALPLYFIGFSSIDRLLLLSVNLGFTLHFY